MPEDNISHIDFDDLDRKAISKPLIKHMYTADPVCPCIRRKNISSILLTILNQAFPLMTWAVISRWKIIMYSPWTICDGAVTDHGVALHVKDVPWAEKQMWAPDAAYRNGKYYLYFPAKRPDGIFQIGVAIGNPCRPFYTGTGADKKQLFH